MFTYVIDDVIKQSMLYLISKGRILAELWLCLALSYIFCQV